jgi:O-Antigen ligase
VTTIAENRLPMLRVAGAVGIAGLATITGAVVAVKPAAGLALVGVLALVGLAFLAPMTHLTLLLFVVALVPYGIQNSVSPGGAGLVPSDLLLLTGLFRAGITLLREPLDRRRMIALGLLLAFLAIVMLQAVHGLQDGRPPSQVGYELRILLGFSTLAIAIPIVADRRGPLQMATVLMGLGLLLGLWGLAQWTLGIKEIAESGLGVREGINFAPEGAGQLQGGLYAYPVAVILSFAALVNAGGIGSWTRVLLITILATNFVDLILTYERTFWVAAVLGMLFVVLRSGPGRRAKALLMGTVAAVLLLVTLAALSPTEFTAARQRLMSLGQYSSDNSVRTRLLETRHVVTAIDRSPITGSGLGATIFWGQSWNDVPPEATWYAHNGYLWVIWKAGLVAGILLFLLMGWSVFARPPPGEEPLRRTLRIGSQGALLALLASSFTFPSFNALEITAVMGVLAALCLTQPLSRGSTRTA